MVIRISRWLLGHRQKWWRHGPFHWVHYNSVSSASSRCSVQSLILPWSLFAVKNVQTFCCLNIRLVPILGSYQWSYPEKVGSCQMLSLRPRCSFRYDWTPTPLLWPHTCQTCPSYSKHRFKFIFKSSAFKNRGWTQILPIPSCCLILLATMFL